MKYYKTAYGARWSYDEGEVSAFWSAGQDGTVAYVFVLVGVDGTARTHQDGKAFEATSEDKLEDEIVEKLMRWLCEECGWVEESVQEITDARSGS